MKEFNLLLYFIIGMFIGEIIYYKVLYKPYEYKEVILEEILLNKEYLCVISNPYKSDTMFAIPMDTLKGFVQYKGMTTQLYGREWYTMNSDIESFQRLYKIRN